MRLTLLILSFSCYLISNAQQKDWNNANLEQLDAEQFRRLEQGEKQLEQIPLLIIEKSKGKPSIFLINAYTVLGIINKNKGYYVSSLNYQLQALSCAEKLTDKGRISASLNNIGTLYLLQENYDKAIIYFERSLKLEESLNNAEQKSIRLYNLGDAYKRKGQLDEAMGFFTSSLLIERKLKNEIGIAYALLGQADVYLRMNRLNDLESTISKIQSNELDDEGKIEFYLLQGGGEIARKNYTNAIKIFMIGVELAENNQSRTYTSELYFKLATCYEQLADLNKANVFYKKHITIYKQLQSNLIKNQLEDLTYQNQLKEKELKIAYLKEQQDLFKKNATIQEKLRTFDWKIVFFSIASVIGIVITIAVGIKKILSKQ